MRLRALAVCLLALLIAACGLKVPDNIGLPAALSGGDPRTLEAATAAAQERHDRFASEDYAGAWLISSKQMQASVSQNDFVAFQKTCANSLSRLPSKITGIRMDGSDQAIVREDVMGFKNSTTMVYEDGKWRQAAADFWIQNAGKSAAQLIAEQRAAGKCGNAALTPPDFTSSQTPTPTPTSTPTPGSCSVNVPGCEGYDECHPVDTGKTDCFPDDESCSRPGNNFPWCAPPTTTEAMSPPPPTNFSTSDVRATRPGETGHLAAVRLGPRDGYDRLVLEFTDLVPGYQIGYRPLPMQEDTSGAYTTLPGASSAVRITLTSATASGTYLGPSTVTADTSGIVTDVKAAGDFEAVLNWVVGLRAEAPFRVLVLDGPPRLVIDFQR